LYGTELLQGAHPVPTKGWVWKGDLCA